MSPLGRTLPHRRSRVVVDDDDDDAPRRPRTALLLPHVIIYLTDYFQAIHYETSSQTGKCRRPGLRQEIACASAAEAAASRGAVVASPRGSASNPTCAGDPGAHPTIASWAGVLTAPLADLDFGPRPRRSEARATPVTSAATINREG